MFLRLKKALGIAAISLVAQPLLAAEPIKFGLCYDLTKIYSFAAPQLVQAERDLAALVNSQGGIEGHPVEFLLQEHGNEPQRGIECYERMKAAGVVAVDTLSSPVSRALLPRVMKDGIVMTQPMVGRSDTVDGEVFKWVFPIGATYWGMAANAVQYAKSQSGGSLKGKRIAFLYIDYPFGQEPIGILKELQKREGFDLGLYPYPLPGNDQSSAWSQMRRAQPDYIIHWGTAVMQVVAAKEAQRNGISMSKIITTPWINDVDIANIGPDLAKGLKKVAVFASGSYVPLLRKIKTEVYGKDKGNGDIKWLGDKYYNLGLASFAPVFEGARLALKNYGAPLTADKLRKGMESIRDFNADGLMAPLVFSEKDHGGGGKTRIEMYDGKAWVPQTDWAAAYDDLVWQAVKASSAEYLKTNK
ncbi:MAG: ABC transporter substrate-binding protein [Hydrogenophaga sp.]